MDHLSNYFPEILFYSGVIIKSYYGKNPDWSENFPKLVQNLKKSFLHYY